MVREEADPWLGFRQAVKAARRQRGWLQSDLAREARVSRPALSKIESGATANPERKTVDRIARALGLSGHPGTNGSSAADALTLVQARRDLPRAPSEALRRYLRLTLETELIADEMTELRQLYGPPSGRPSSRPRGASS